MTKLTSISITILSLVVLLVLNIFNTKSIAKESDDIISNQSLFENNKSNIVSDLNYISLSEGIVDTFITYLVPDTVQEAMLLKLRNYNRDSSSIVVCLIKELNNNLVVFDFVKISENYKFFYKLAVNSMRKIRIKNNYYPIIFYKYDIQFAKTSELLPVLSYGGKIPSFSYNLVTLIYNTN